MSRSVRILVEAPRTEGDLCTLGLFPSEAHRQPCANRSNHIMDGTIDKAKGRIKEAAGALTDDDKLRKAGKLDQSTGKAKDVVGRVQAAAANRIDVIRAAFKRNE
jgi:uncharacterized protein YjbJ (UPF0337 family)